MSVAPSGGPLHTTLAATLAKSGESVKAGPIGLAVILLLCIACYFLFRSMSKHMKQVREHFPTDAPAAPSTAPRAQSAPIVRAEPTVRAEPRAPADPSAPADSGTPVEPAAPVSEADQPTDPSRE